MRVQDIQVGELYTTSDCGWVRVENVYFDEDWQEYCVQARGHGTTVVYTFTPDDLEET